MQTDNQCSETQQAFNKKQSEKLDKCLYGFFLSNSFWKGALNLDKRQVSQNKHNQLLERFWKWGVGGRGQ